MDFTAFILENGPQDVDSPILVDAEQPDRTISWQEYAVSIKRVAVGLRKFGLVDGESVALLSPGDISYYILGDGVVAGGGVFAPISPYGTRHETAQRLKSADAAWVFVAPEFMEDVKAAAQTAGIPSSRVCIFDACSPSSVSSHKTFSSLLKSDESAWISCQGNDSNGDRTCYRLLTSGSTGSPKGVDLSHKVMIARCQFQLRSKQETRLKALHFIDFHHVSAAIVCNSSVLGIHVLYCSRRTSTTSIVDNISKYGIDNLALYPKLMLELIETFQKGFRDPAQLASLRNIACGGSIVPTWSLEAFNALLPRDAKLRVMYGTTESSSVTTLLPNVPLVPGFVGCYVPGIDVTIVDPETGEDVGCDVDGEICVRGPMVFEKYFDNKSATKAAFLTNSKGKWYRTGDKGHFSSSVQQLAITGRYKDVFVVGSEKVSPDEVEETLIQHNAIADVVVTSTPDQEHEGLYKPMAYVVAPDQTLTAQDVINFAAERLSSFKIPTGGVVFCDGIPRTDGLQKVRRKALENVCGQPRSVMNLTAAR